jgi:hypothetical protein
MLLWVAVVAAFVDGIPSVFKWVLLALAVTSLMVEAAADRRLLQWARPLAPVFILALVASGLAVLFTSGFMSGATLATAALVSVAAEVVWEFRVLARMTSASVGGQQEQV